MTITRKPKTATVVKEIKLFETDSAITKALVSVEKRSGSVMKEYQVIALSLIVKLAKDGDIMLVRRMLDKFPESMRANSMKRWLETFGPVRFATEGDKLKDDTIEVGIALFDNSKKLQLGSAMEKMWYTSIKEETYKPMDLDTMIDNIIKLAEARLKKGVKVGVDNINVDKLAKLKAL